MVARHYRSHPESWQGGFGRNRAQDIIDLELNPLPPGDVKLENFKVNGHEVSYRGDLLLGFRLDGEGDLLSFYGRDCNEVTIDGKNTVFADSKVDLIAWMPVVQSRQIPGQAFFQIWLEGDGEVSIPLKTSKKKLKMFEESSVQGMAGKEIPFKYKKGRIILELNGDNTGKWLYLTGN